MLIENFEYEYDLSMDTVLLKQFIIKGSQKYSF